MPRMFRIVVFSVLASATVAGCKTERSKKPDEATKVVDPGKSRDKPSDPAVKPPELPEPAARDPEVTGQNTEVQNKGLAMMQRVSELFAARADDCEKLATELRELSDSNRELQDQLNAEMAKLDANERDAFMARNKAAYDAAMTKMGPALQACGSNKSFQAALRQVARE